MSDTLSDAPSLPPDVCSEDDREGGDASDPGSVSLPSDVLSDVEPGNLQKHCSCRLHCYQKFDEAEIEHGRAEALKDQQVRLQNVFVKVKGFVGLSTKTARIDWQMGGQKVCRPFWEYCHSVGHKQVDDMVKLAKLGHAALPEKGARMPKEASYGWGWCLVPQLVYRSCRADPSGRWKPSPCARTSWLRSSARSCPRR